MPVKPRTKTTHEDATELVSFTCEKSTMTHRESPSSKGTLTQVRSRISPRFGELCTPVLGASKAPYVHSSNNGDGAKPSGRTSQLLCSTSAEKTTKVQTVAKELKCPVGTESLPSKQRF